ncbi:hypothetical protein EJ06DRAFT_119380 [Trichodelitschia bisporula]|uniref:Uncharacterized protein n=1 Tax=Trichodelitschia bisporula TaxID=703511 RepID=A0A6G1HPT4_9PEZI|nr:hypothetical protein EJ06DRAFT_119380 [Trichodelitschia bisporula]
MEWLANYWSTRSMLQFLYDGEYAEPEAYEEFGQPITELERSCSTTNDEEKEGEDEIAAEEGSGEEETVNGDQDEDKTVNGNQDEEQVPGRPTPMLFHAEVFMLAIELDMDDLGANAEQCFIACSAWNVEIDDLLAATKVVWTDGQDLGDAKCSALLRPRWENMKRVIERELMEHWPEVQAMEDFKIISHNYPELLMGIIWTQYPFRVKQESVWT